MPRKSIVNLLWILTNKSSTLFYNDDNYSQRKVLNFCRIKGQEIAVNHLRVLALEQKILFDDCLNMYIQYLGYIHTLRHRLGIRFFIQRIIRKNAKSEKSISISAYIKFCIKHIIPLSVVNLLRFHWRKFKEMPLL